MRSAIEKAPPLRGGAKSVCRAHVGATTRRGPAGASVLLRARRERLEHRGDRFEQEARVVFGVLIEENLDHREYAGDRCRGGRKELIGEIGIVLAVNINIGPDDLFLLRPPFRDGREDGSLLLMASLPTTRCRNNAPAAVEGLKEVGQIMNSELGEGVLAAIAASADTTAPDAAPWPLAAFLLALSARVRRPLPP